MQNLERLGYVKTWDDTAHPIVHIRKVTMSMQDGQTKYLGDVLHVRFLLLTCKSHTTTVHERGLYPISPTLEYMVHSVNPNHTYVAI